jgi:putative ABC transport system ATP-binding protein
MAALMSNTDVVIRVSKVTKDLSLGKITIHALRGVDMEIRAGEIVSIVGPSGSGKSTLLGLIGGLDTPSQGAIEIDGVDISHLNEDQLTEVRNEKIGFIFQFFNLIPTLTALETWRCPSALRAARFKPDKRAKELLQLLGLEDRMHHRPAELSGGQQQRSPSHGRWRTTRPSCWLTSRPGNLDSESGVMVLDALHNIRTETGTTVAIVTHDIELAQSSDRVVTLVDGEIVNSLVKQKPGR